jgi:hypothetical protein
MILTILAIALGVGAGIFCAEKGFSPSGWQFWVIASSVVGVITLLGGWT